MEVPLFRPQALARQGERLDGDPMLAVPLKFSLISILLVVTTTTALTFLALGDYTRKQPVRGVLAPGSGLVRIHPTQTGRIHAMHVRQGEAVTAGSPLFTLRMDVQAGEEGPALEALLRELNRQRNRLAARLEVEREHLQDLRRRQEAVRARMLEEARRLRRVQDNEARLRDIRGRALARAETLRAAGVLTEVDLDGARENLLVQENALAARRLESARLQTRLHEARLAWRTAETAGEREVAALLAALGELEQQRLRIEAERQGEVTAPVSGRIAGVAGKPGQTVTPGDAVMTIIPGGAPLVARLAVPGEAIGFLEPGLRINIRYDAFPHQKFGIHKATVSEVASAADRAGTESSSGFVYRANAELETQHVIAYGREVPLKSGMTFQADIVLDERTLLEWLLDPLLSITGRVL